MVWTDVLQYSALFAAVLSVGSVIRQRDTISTLKDSNSALKERIELVEEDNVKLKEETAACLASHDINDRKITALESRLSTYDDLALVPKDFIVKHDQSQQKIVSILERIEGNQPNKTAVARAVKRVKTDLEQSKEAHV